MKFEAGYMKLDVQMYTPKFEYGRMDSDLSYRHFAQHKLSKERRGSDLPFRHFAQYIQSKGLSSTNTQAK
jgi:hypothetical protein